MHTQQQVQTRGTDVHAYLILDLRIYGTEKAYSYIEIYYSSTIDTTR